ncbi:TPA: hypothetical protein EYP44_01025, partial [Candidatus Bathyarchaeota archaeon]|nr:hypothetical protein [Candidatus Bathyarchaeota archaeon]
MSDSIALVMSFVVSVCMGMTMLSIPLLASLLEADASLIGLIWGASLMSYVIFCGICGRALDAIGGRPLIRLGLVTNSLASLSFLLCDSPLHMLVVAPFLGAAGAMFWPAVEVWVARGGDGGTLVRDVGSYNIAWLISMGASFGGAACILMLESTSRPLIPNWEESLPP